MAKCTGCGLDLVFDPKSQKLKCPGCLSMLDVQSHQSISIQEQTYDGVSEFVCPCCGGSIYSTDSTAATFCSFCGTSVVLERHDSTFQFPDAIIPFEITKEEATQAYLKRVKRSPFLPKALRDDTSVEKTRGIYMPYVHADIAGHGDYEIKSKREYTEGTYDVTVFYKDTGYADIHHEMTRDTLSEFADVLSTGVGPFTTQKQQPFNASYLSGFYADKADKQDEALEDMVAESQQVSANQLLKQGASHVPVAVVKQPTVAVEAKKNLLCPIWFISNSQSDGSVSYAAVNGQTGMVAAELPIDRNKYLLWSGIIGIVVYALLLLSGLAFSPHTATGVMMVMAALVAGLIFFQARRVYVHDQELSGQSVPIYHKKGKVDIFGIISVVATFFVCIGLAMFVTPLVYEDDMPILLVFALVATGIAILNARLRGQGSYYIVPFKAIAPRLLKVSLIFLASALMFIVNPYMDWLQYLISTVSCVLTAWSFLDLLKLHNLASSRKPSQLAKRGGFNQ